MHAGNRCDVHKMCIGIMRKPDKQLRKSVWRGKISDRTLESFVKKDYRMNVLHN